MNEYTFQLESDYSLVVVRVPDFKRAHSIVASTCLTNAFWLVDEKPNVGGGEGIDLGVA